MAYVDRFAGTLRGVRERLAYLLELGVTYLHLMPLLRTRPGAERRRLRRRRLRRGGARAGHDGRPARAGGGDRARRACRCAWTSCSTTRRGSIRGRSRRGQGDARRLAFYRTFADRSEPDAYERTLPEVFPDTAPGNFTWDDGARAAGCGRRSTPTSGISTTPTPRCSSPWPSDAGARGRRRRRPAAGRRPLPVEAARDRLPEPARGPRPPAGVQAGRADRGARRWRSRPRRSSSPRDLVGYLGVGRHVGMECDLAYHNVLMVLLWSTLATRQRRAPCADAAVDAADARRARGG